MPTSSAITCFRELFGASPTHAAIAPGRVNLIGEHTDYSGGFVLPMAINRVCAAAGRVVSERAPGQVRVWSVNERALVEFDAATLGPGEGWHGRGWSSYIAGVLAMMTGHAGGELPSMEIAIAGDVPLGAGLSSSAALEVSVAALIAAIAGLHIEPAVIARMARAAERGYGGMPCGIMDQLVSACAVEGHALLIDCADERMAPVLLDGLGGAKVLVIDSTVKHALVSGEYKRRAEGCAEAARVLGIAWLRDATEELIDRHAAALGDELARYARHVVTENGRVEAFVEAMRRGDRASIGSLMLGSHASLRDDFRVSCPELDAIVKAAMDGGGVHGCRMTGGGFGGSAVAIVEADGVGRCIERVERTTKDRFGIAPRSFVVTPSAGARAWKI